MQGEEHRRPGRVEQEHEEEGDLRLQRIGMGGAPDPPDGDGHEDIERGPDGTEDPVGWVEGWLLELGVPGGNLRDRRQRAEGAEAEG